MVLDPVPPAEDDRPQRPSLGVVLSIFIVLAGVIALLVILVAYGLMAAL